MQIKKLGKHFLSSRLETQVKKLRANNDFRIIAVAGSVGKTTTKLAIAKLLATGLRVQYQSGNYNDRLTVPLVFFGQTEPGIFNVFGWLRVLRTNARQLRQPYPFDVVVLELGSDGPGQIQDFAYLQPDIAVITALTDEHMEYFKTIDAVAEEELTVARFTRQTLVNIDDSPEKYLSDVDYKGYGLQTTDYQVINRQPQVDGGQLLHVNFDGDMFQFNTSLLGKQGAKSMVAAAAVAKLCGFSNQQIIDSAVAVTAVSGRMQLLQGVNGSTIIDDSYNASPIAMQAALDVLYATPATKRIALLGNMNEMGELSPNMHKAIGKYCDPSKLDLVITLGPDANRHLAPAAKARGCKVVSFDSPYDAGAYIQSELIADTVVLIKGSQNRVFAEEAIKSLLADPADAAKLVRQSDQWLSVKQQQFR